ncbi:DNA-binding protein [Streptomyces beijiangensis]|uniref:DNA-binding protein n=1 Tax=Streptomyces beijiangensis TaxID=163361 RepID=A0A939FC91_9ACTN|nr:DNA-binding protein [Streptomyces beijiangensis]MBO0514395.1 DNA-binding protein [Streptomyces beijiangensis]
MTAVEVGTLVLDCEGLSKLVADDRGIAALVQRARHHGAHVVTSAVTPVEARHPGIAQARFDWVLSRIDIAPVTEDISRDASKLLAAAGVHGHKYALDAILAATALRQPGPVVVLTSDPEDITLLCGPRVRIVKV